MPYNFLTFNSTHFRTDSLITANAMYRSNQVNRSLATAGSTPEAVPALPCLDLEFRAIVADACNSLFLGQQAVINKDVLDLYLTGTDADGLRSFRYWSVARVSDMLTAVTSEYVPKHSCYVTADDIAALVGNAASLEFLIQEAADMLEMPKADQSVKHICAYDTAPEHPHSYLPVQEELLRPGVFSALAFTSCLFVNMLEFVLEVPAHVREVRITHSGPACSGRDLLIALCFDSAVDIDIVNSIVEKSFPKCCCADDLFAALLDRLTLTDTSSAHSKCYSVPDVWGRSMLVNSCIEQYNLKSLRFVQAKVVALDAESDVAMYASTADTLGKFVPINA